MDTLWASLIGLFLIALGVVLAFNLLQGRQSRLRDAWRDILARARLTAHHTITREQLSVREHMSIVLRRLQGRRFVEFHDLFDTTRGTPVLVVTFIAMLELSRERLLEVTQAEAFAPIYVRLAYAPS